MGGPGTPGGEETRKGQGGRPRRGALSPEQITETAIRIADAEGLDAVSIRRVAAELDARPMSLYDHFLGKDEILASMLEKVVAEVLLPERLPSDWRLALQAIARRMYATFIAHPWLVVLFGRQPSFGPNSKRAASQAARATADLPLEQAERWTFFGTLNDYVLGHSLRAVTAPRRDDLEDLISEADVAESPQLASLSESLRSRGAVERFEIGLEAVLDGLERRFLDHDGRRR